VREFSWDRQIDIAYNTADGLPPQATLSPIPKSGAPRRGLWGERDQPTGKHLERDRQLRDDDHKGNRPGRIV
jgi:hypothetical protein